MVSFNKNRITNIIINVIIVCISFSRYTLDAITHIKGLSLFATQIKTASDT